MTEMMPGDGLSSDMLRLIAHVTSPLAESASKLMGQAERAIVVRYSPTMLDVEVPSDISVVDLPDGPTPGRVLVYEREQLVGEVLVWIRDGRLIGLEQAWFTDDPPKSWPSPEMVRIS